MNGIFDGSITEALSPQGIHIVGGNLIRCQGQLFYQPQGRPKFFANGGSAPVAQNRLAGFIAQGL